MPKQTYIVYPGDERVLLNVLDAIRNRDVSKPWRITMEVYRKNRSAEQNAYYWGVVLPTIQAFIMDSRGDHYSCDDIHEFYRDEYLPKRTIKIKGMVKVVRPSTASLTTKQFSDYLEIVIHHCAENGIVIPAPEWRD